jgi:outer membrane protein OmpA-like peptidoglycan-associated protein
MEVKLNLFRRPTLIFFTLSMVVLIILSGSGLTGCASSAIERNAETNVDTVYENSNYMLTHPGDPAGAFQNSSQTTKGILIGTTTGALAAGVISGTSAILPGAVGGAIAGGVVGAYIDYHTNIVDQLENRGVKVMTLGDQVMIIMSSAWTFDGRSARIRPQANSTLDLIAQYIHRYATESVKVAAYTNDSGDNSFNCYMSQQQADRVVKYLWPRLNTRLLFATGYGGTHLIESNNQSWDKGANYRIEISFTKLPT